MCCRPCSITSHNGERRSSSPVIWSTSWSASATGSASWTTAASSPRCRWSVSRTGSSGCGSGARPRPPLVRRSRSLLASAPAAARADASPLQAGELLQAVQSWGTLYPVLAAALGLLVAIATWAPDHRGRHVHALSLPLPRWRYVLLRFGAGAALLAAPVIAVS